MRAGDVQAITGGSDIRIGFNLGNVVVIAGGIIIGLVVFLGTIRLWASTSLPGAGLAKDMSTVTHYAVGAVA